MYIGVDLGQEVGLEGIEGGPKVGAVEDEEVVVGDIPGHQGLKLDQGRQAALARGRGSELRRGRRRSSQEAGPHLKRRSKSEGIGAGVVGQWIRMRETRQKGLKINDDAAI